MVGHFLKFLYLSDVGSHDGLFFLVHTDGTENFGVHELMIIKIPQSKRKLSLVSLIENYLGCASVIVDLKNDPHLIVYARYDSPDNDDLFENKSKSHPTSLI